MKTSIVHSLSVLLLAGACVLSAGCTHMIKPPAAAFTGYAPQEKMNLKVGLRLTPELREAKWEAHHMGDTWVIPIGPSLCQNSETLARHLFREVIDVSDTPANQAASADAILTPKLAYINRTTGATSFGESIVSIKVEWDLSDPNGNPIWVDTVGGQGSGSTGWTDPEKIVKTAVEDLLKKSQSAITSADAIKKYADKKR